MRQARENQQGRSQGISLPVPIGGWNAQDNLDNMPISEALELQNFIPRGNYLQLRNGYSLKVQLPNVDTLMTLELDSTNSKFLAATETNIYTLDLSAGTSSSIKGSQTNGRWQYVQYKDRLFMCNGANTPQVYDGSTISDTTYTGSGLTVTNLIGVNLYQNRLFFIEKDSMSCWYANVAGSVGGASGLSEIDFNYVFQRGGTLQAIMTWTQDGGNGTDDQIVFLSSEGEVLIYQGTDPSDADKWTIKGRFDIPRPIGRRCYEKVGGDLIIITQEGYFPLSRVLGVDNRNEASVSNKIDNVIKGYSSYFSFFGWQIKWYSRGNYLLVNVPLTTNSQNSEQHILTITTNSWCKFTNQTANCWETHQENLYFANSVGIYQADTGSSDNGAFIEGYFQQAYSDFGNPNVKKIQLIKPIYTFTGDLDYSLRIGVDFKLGNSQLSPNNNIAVNATLWDVSPWDTSPWGTEEDVSSKIQSVFTSWGNKFSIGFVTKTKTDRVLVYSTKLLLESGVNWS